MGILRRDEGPSQPEPPRPAAHESLIERLTHGAVERTTSRSSVRESSSHSSSAASRSSRSMTRQQTTSLPVRLAVAIDMEGRKLISPRVKTAANTVVSSVGSGVDTVVHSVDDGFRGLQRSLSRSGLNLPLASEAEAPLSEQTLARAATDDPIAVLIAPDQDERVRRGDQLLVIAEDEMEANEFLTRDELARQGESTRIRAQQLAERVPFDGDEEDEEGGAPAPSGAVDRKLSAAIGHADVKLARLEAARETRAESEGKPTTLVAMSQEIDRHTLRLELMAAICVQKMVRGWFKRNRHEHAADVEHTPLDATGLSDAKKAALKASAQRVASPKVVAIVGWQRNFGRLLRAFDAQLPPGSQIYLLSSREVWWRRKDLTTEGLADDGSATLSGCFSKVAKKDKGGRSMGPQERDDYDGEDGDDGDEDEDEELQDENDEHDGEEEEPEEEEDVEVRGTPRARLAASSGLASTPLPSHAPRPSPSLSLARRLLTSRLTAAAAGGAPARPTHPGDWPDRPPRPAFRPRRGRRRRSWAIPSTSTTRSCTTRSAPRAAARGRTYGACPPRSRRGRGCAARAPRPSAGSGSRCTRWAGRRCARASRRRRGRTAPPSSTRWRRRPPPTMASSAAASRTACSSIGRAAAPPRARTRPASPPPPPPP